MLFGWSLRARRGFIDLQLRKKVEGQTLCLGTRSDVATQTGSGWKSLEVTSFALCNYTISTLPYQFEMDIGYSTQYLSLMLDILILMFAEYCTEV